MLQRSPKHHIYTYIISWWNYSKAPFLGISLTWNLRPSRGIYNSPYIHHHLWFEALRSLVEVVVKYTQILSGLFMGLSLTLYLHVYHNYISSKKPINILCISKLYIISIFCISTIIPDHSRKNPSTFPSNPNRTTEPPPRWHAKSPPPAPGCGAVWTSAGRCGTGKGQGSYTRKELWLFMGF